MCNSFQKYLYENSLFLQNIDKFIFASVLAVFFASTFMSSDAIGCIALITVFLTLVKYSVNPRKIEFKNFELWLLAYFMLVIISLSGSTLFHLSLKGFFKTFTYLAFYVSLSGFIKSDKSKISYIIGAIGLCAGFEGIVGLMQNYAHVNEISTWQDISNLNPEQIMTRVYGTLKPLNPNLLGGYFVSSVPCLYGFSAFSFTEKKYKLSLCALILAVLSTLTLFLTGCRGSYIAMLVIICGIFSVSAKYLIKNYRKIYLTLVSAIASLVVLALVSVTSLRTRILSIFAMREDSSNSFRFNVYQSSVQMLKENWLLGVGVGNQNFREIYGLYMKTGFDALSAYNIFLEIAVESGIFALTAYLGFLITLIKDAVKHILKSDDIKSVIFVSTALISICAVSVHGFVDTVFFRPQIQFVFWTMAAIIRSLS